MAESNRAHIIAVTEQYLYHGIVETGEKRLSDIVNDRRNGYLEILEARAHKLTRPEKAEFVAAKFNLKKLHTVAVAVMEEEVHQAPLRTDLFVQKERRKALLVLPGYELRGFIHMQRTHQLTGPLMREGRLFVPVTDATLSSTVNPRIKVNSPTVLLREAAIDGFTVTEQEPG